jgi:membrane-bound ClpP family serine protease
MTALLSILLLGILPSGTKLVGIALALIAAVLLAIEPEPPVADTSVSLTGISSS